MSNDCLYELARIRIYRKCDGYYLRWYYNGWHYWFFYPGSINFETEGEKYWTLGTQKMRIGTGQITEEQCEAIRTIQNTIEIYIWTDNGWGVVRLEPNSLVVYDHALHGYEIEIEITIGSRAISSTGFSPVDELPSKEPDAPWICELSIPIAGQTWMCYNWDAAYPGSKVYNDDEENRTKFGGLYTYAQVMSAGFVPDGWHVPSEAEFQILIDALGGDAAAGGELKYIGTTYWNAPNTGATDSVDFGARGAGRYSASGFVSIYQYAWFICSDEPTLIGANYYCRTVRFDYNSAAVVVGYMNVGNYMSLRLIKDIHTPGWFVLTVPIPASCTFYSMNFINEDIGWAVGRTNLSKNLIVRTTDGGDNWNVQTSSILINSRLQCVSAVDTNNAWVCGYDSLGVGVVEVTNNAGTNWTQQAIPLAAHNLYSIKFIDVNNGWCVGNAGANAYIINTANGGTNWNQQISPVANCIYRGVSFVDVNNGWAVGYTAANVPVIANTANGGALWIAQVPPIAVNVILYGVYFVNANTGWAVGQETAVGTPIIFATVDGGTNWTQQTPPTSYAANSIIYCVHFIDANNGWAAGNYNTGEIYLVYTTDGGANWVEATDDLPVIANSTIFAIQFINENIGYACGNDFMDHLMMKYA